jgi:hypothetical protein
MVNTMSADSIPQLGATGRILEGIVTTQNSAGAINIAPMGPVVDDDFETFVLRPFQTSTTFANLVQTREGVLQITDDVELFASAAIGRVEAPTFLADHPLVIANACRWFEFKVISIDDSQQRSCIIARTRARGTLRDFFGFNRATHAVIEAAILATRLHILPTEEILAEFERLQPLVDKTGAASERRAFDLLRQHIEQTLAAETA